MLSHLEQVKQDYEKALSDVIHCPPGNNVYKAIDHLREFAIEYEKLDDEGE